MTHVSGIDRSRFGLAAAPDPAIRDLPLPRADRDVELWLVDLPSYPWPAKQDWLSFTEAARAERYVFKRDQVRYRAAHCALREILSARLNRHPASLHLLRTESGKPYLASGATAPGASCRFSLSRSADVALIGVARNRDIGVDVESARAVDAVASLAEYCFTARERQELQAFDAADRSRAFLVGWTRKEACLKAIGCGLSVRPDSFYVGLTGQPSVADVNSATFSGPVRVENIDTGPDCIAAVAWPCRTSSEQRAAT